MIKIILPVFLLSFLAISSGCKKSDSDPVANFSVSKPNPYVDEFVTFTNTSTNAHHVKWTFPDGNTATNNTISYAFPSSGLYTVTLDAFNKNETVSDSYSFTVSVCVSGRVIFYTDSATYKTPININFAGEFAGTLSSYLNTTPTCGNPNGVTAEICPGTYTYTATDGNNKTWSNLVKIIPNNCTVIKLN